MFEYTTDSITRYHLSPYVRIWGTPNGVELQQTLFGGTISLHILPKHSGLLLDALSAGCSKGQLLEILRLCFEAHADDVLKQLILGGYIE